MLQMPSIPVRRAKLRSPSFTPALVSRPRLTARFSASLSAPLTLISAPAGYGKTTLLAEWLDTLAAPAAWLTADAGDRDSQRFVTYLIASLDRAVPGSSIVNT